MPEPMHPRLTGDEVRGRAFSTARRGFDQGDVRAYLRTVGDELDELNREVAEVEELRGRLFEVEAELAELRSAPPIDLGSLDAAALTSALGEETARVLLTAREAGDEVRARAHDQ